MREKHGNTSQKGPLQGGKPAFQGFVKEKGYLILDRRYPLPYRSSIAAARKAKDAMANLRTA